jgi:hypothetical protein
MRRICRYLKNNPYLEKVEELDYKVLNESLEEFIKSGGSFSLREWIKRMIFRIAMVDVVLSVAGILLSGSLPWLPWFCFYTTGVLGFFIASGTLFSGTRVWREIELCINTRKYTKTRLRNMAGVITRLLTICYPGDPWYKPKPLESYTDTFNRLLNLNEVIIRTISGYDPDGLRAELGFIVLIDYWKVKSKRPKYWKDLFQKQLGDMEVTYLEEVMGENTRYLYVPFLGVIPGCRERKNAQLLLQDVTTRYWKDMEEKDRYGFLIPTPERMCETKIPFKDLGFELLISVQGRYYLWKKPENT